MLSAISKPLRHVVPALGPSLRGFAFKTFDYGDPKQPVVIVVQEAWGVNEEIKGKAKQLADAGFHAIIPDLYDGKNTVEFEEAMHLVGNFNIPKGLQEMDNLVGDLRRDQPARKIGLMGFCFGSMLAIASAIHSKNRIDAVAGFYGIPPPELADVNQLKTPLIYQMGEKDMSPISTLEITERMEAVLKASGKTYELYKYPNAGHAFLNNDKTYDKARAAMNFPPNDPLVAKQAWDRAITFLRKYL